MSEPSSRDAPWRTAALTAFTMVAFAANSLLCRMALGRELIDPLSFTTARVVSGAVVLVVLSRGLGLAAKDASDAPGAREGQQRREGQDGPEAHEGRKAQEGQHGQDGRGARGAVKAGAGDAGSRGAREGWAGSWISALALFGYAAAFSLAYVSLEAGTGALILFGAVQATMIGAGIRSGERPHWAEWLGLILAVGGLVYLTAPGATAPDPIGALLMLVSGISWGVYSLLGKGVRAPIVSTTRSFVRAAPMAILGTIVGLSFLRIEAAGLLLAVVSGAVTSGLGYALWYRALRGLTRTRAAIVQLVVPVLAALGGVAFLAESITQRLVLASIGVLGGVTIAVVLPRRRAPVVVGGDSAG